MLEQHPGARDAKTWLEPGGVEAELQLASFEAVVPMAAILAGVFAVFLAWNTARLGPALTPAMTVNHALAIAWFVTVAAVAHGHRRLARYGHAAGAALAVPAAAVCLHLEVATGDPLYAAFIGLAVVAVPALIMSTAWAAATAGGVVVAALAIGGATGAGPGDAAGVLVVAGAIGAAIHVVRRRCRLRVVALRQAERRAASERLAATAQLAGGLAHDINNLLSVIAINADLLAEPGLAADEREVLCAELRDAARRGTALTRQLVACGRPAPEAAPAIAVGAEVELLAPILTRAVGPAVAVRVAVATAARVAFDAAQLGQVLLNLAINARDAMADGGRLSVTVRDAERGASPATVGAWVAIEVRDTGAGMDAATARRAFEPYFTTKPAGRGTGLGLAMVRDIVRQHGGTIDLTSAPGAGTAVMMYLPVAVTGPAAVAPPAAPDAPAPRLTPALALGR